MCDASLVWCVFVVGRGEGEGHVGFIALENPSLYYQGCLIYCVFFRRLSFRRRRHTYISLSLTNVIVVVVIIIIIINNNINAAVSESLEEIEELSILCRILRRIHVVSRDLGAIFHISDLRRAPERRTRYVGIAESGILFIAICLVRKDVHDSCQL